MPGGFPLGLEICNPQDVGVVLSQSAGTTVAGGNAAYGSFVQLVASTASDTVWCNCQVVSVGTPPSVVKIAVGAAASEKTVVADLMVQAISGILLGSSYSFPLSIPKGTRVSAAASSGGASGNVTVSLQLYDGAFTQIEGAAGVDSIGVAIATATGTTITASGTANTKGSYSQLIASTSRDYAGLFLGVDTGTINSAYSLLFDVAIGGAGSEQIIIPDLNFRGNAGGTTPNTFPYLPIPIKSGTRIAARSACTIASQTFGLTAYGVFA